MARNKGGTESIKRKIDALRRTKQDLPKKLANTAQTFFKQSFRNEGWTDQNIQRWQPRKGELGKGISKLKRGSSSGRGILMKSGNLRNSIYLAMVSWNRIRIESDLDYAAIHNYGKQGLAWGKYKFKMPKRKFMGNSYRLRQQLRTKIETTLNRVMRA
jgi:phage gpG-like protein